MTQRDMNEQQLDQAMQQKMIEKIQEHMAVKDREGAHVGTVDKVEGSRIKLTRNDHTNSQDNEHHYIDMEMVASVDDVAVYLDDTLENVKDRIFNS